MTNSADPDQLASEANWSGSTLFAKTGHDVFSKRRVKPFLDKKKSMFEEYEATIFTGITSLTPIYEPSLSD